MIKRWEKKFLPVFMALALVIGLLPAITLPAMAAPGPCLLDFETPGELAGFETKTVTYANTASGTTFTITAEASSITKGSDMYTDVPFLLRGTEDLYFITEMGVTIAATDGKTFDLQSFYLFNNNDPITYTVTTDQGGNYTETIPAGNPNVTMGMVQIDPPDTAAFRGITWFKITPTGGTCFALDDISVNIAPVFSSGAAASYAENATGPAYTAAASGSGAVTYSLPSSGDNALFRIDATTGAVSFVGAPDYENPRDANMDNAYDVTVQAEDSYGTATKAVAITVTDADDIHFAKSDNDSGADSIAANTIAKTRPVAGGEMVDVRFATYPDESAYTCVYGPNENGTFPGGLYNLTGVDSNVGLLISVPAGYSFDLTSFKYAADNVGTTPVSEIDVGTKSDQDAYGVFPVTQGGSVGYTIVKPVSPIADDVNEVVISAAGYVQMQDFEITDIKLANITPAFVGSTTALTVDQDAAATDIKSLLHVSDADSGQTLTWSQSSAPGHGALSFGSATAPSGGTDLITSGTITYKPDLGYAGSDSFTVQVGDGAATVTRTITVTVRSTDAGLTSVAGQTDSTTTGAGTSNDPILWSATVENAKSALSLSDIVVPSAAVKNLYSDAGFTNEITDENTLPLSVGETTAYVKVTAEDTATIRYYAVTITRAAVPSIAQNSGLTVLEGGTGTVTNTQLQTTDADTGAASLTYTVETAPTNGTLKKSGGTLTAGETFTQDDIDNNRVTYTHNGDETASDSFTFSASDGANEITGQTFSITVTPVNDAPTVAVTASTPTFTEGGSAATLFSGAAIGTVESGQTILSFVLSVNDVANSGKEFLNVDGTKIALTDGNSGTTGTNGMDYMVSASGSTATIALSKMGGIIPAAADTLIDAITYQNDSDNPTGTSRTVTLVSVQDNGGTDNGGKDTAALSIASTVTIASVNDAPTDITLSKSTFLAADTGVNAVVGAFGTTDPDNATGFIYTLVSGSGDTDNASFDISGTNLVTKGTLTAGTYHVRVRTSDDQSATYEKELTVTAADKEAVTLTPDTTDNDVDHNLEITFAADADFAGKITGVSFNGHDLAAGQYTVDTTNNNKVTLHPSSDANTYLRTPAAANVVIHATGYMDSSVSQTITAGAMNALEVTTQPVPGTETGDAFATQPVITLKDQYGNVCGDGPSASASVTASALAGTGTWTIGGTVTKAAVNGVVTFSDLSCTLGTSGNGKIKFECGGKSVESSLFAIPERNSGISPVTGAFDLYTSAANYQDIPVTLTLNGNTLNAVKNGAYLLIEGTDYSISGDTLTLKKEYLKTLSTGTVSLTFDFNLGTDPVLAITVTNSTPTSGGGSGSGSNNSGAAVIVNGETKTAGTAQTTTNSSGQTTTTVTVDTSKLENILASQGTGATVTIPITGNSDVAIGTLTGAMVKSMETKDATLVVQTHSGTYTLPASEININAVSQQLGTSVALSDIKVTVSISEPSASMTKVIESAAQDGGFTIMVPAVDYTITCTHGSQTVEVSSFNAYVERTIAIPDGVDPTKITTGVVVDPDGTTHHVPTRVTVMNGKYYAVINSLTNSTYSVVWNPVEFSDVTNHWAKTAINDMGSRMVVNGVGNNNYAPDRNMTRAEFAAIMIRALGLEPGTGASGFGDVAPTDWCCGYIKTAAAYGIVNGYDNGNFGPNDTITREQAMAMIARAMKITGLYAGLADNEVSQLLSNFSDSTSASTYAQSSIAACIKTGITAGSSNATLSPKDCITRAEVAVMIQRLLQKSELI